ncbi:hypothetical protein ACO0LL_26535 [Undibacterium sp. TC4M20W]|uniref:hypothetical protein n=1 Tax=Undibacterium sp. TC4M20W TaxID=3413052 RepID=UPI003BEF9159
MSKFEAVVRSFAVRMDQDVLTWFDELKNAHAAWANTTGMVTEGTANQFEFIRNVLSAHVFDFACRKLKSDFCFAVV